MIWFKFIICVLLIFFSGRRVARDADVIALKTGLGGTFIGVILVAMVTSLPELFTGISSVTIVGVPDLTIGNLLGACTYNLLNLAILDIISQKGLGLKALGHGHYQTAILGIIMVAVVGVSILISYTVPLPGIGWIGWYTPALIILYLLFTRRLFGYEKKQTALKKAERAFAPDYKTTSLRKATISFTLSAMVVIGTGVWLAVLGDEVGDVTGLQKSFVGSFFLALITTLPEITVSYTALRMGAIDLAIANMVGSTLLNMVIVAIDDLLFLKGPILSFVLWTNLITAAAVILMTAVFLAGLRLKARRWFRLSWWNCSLILLFLIRVSISYFLTGST